MGNKIKGTVFIVVVFFAIIFNSCSDPVSSDGLSSPDNLELTLVSDNQVKLTWTDNSKEESKFIIDRKKGEFDWFENYGETEANITSFADIINTNSDTVFSYRIRAFDGNDYSEYSTETGWFSEQTTPLYLQLSQIAQDSIILNWNDRSVGELNFRIDRKIGESNWNENYKILDENVTSIVDYNPSLYDSCNYKIYAVSGSGKSNFAQNYFIPFLPPPTDLDIEPITATEVNLSWTDNCINEEGYKIYKSLQENEWELVETLPENSIQWIEIAVTPGIVNTFKVCAYIGENLSNYAVNSINTLPAPQNFSVIKQGDTYTFQWDDTNFEDGYVIEKQINYNEFLPITNLNQDISSFSYEEEVLHGVFNFRLKSYYSEISSEYSELVQFSNEIWVPEDIITIQLAIDISNDNDVIVVSPGIYSENITIQDRDIVLKSKYYDDFNFDIIEETIIDGGNSGSVLSFIDCYSSSGTVGGFTLRNGNATYGGGIKIIDSHPTLEFLLITENIASKGGGIYSDNWDGFLKNSKIYNNTSTSKAGGCYLENESRPDYFNVIIYNNNSSGSVDGIYSDWSKPDFENVTVYNNNISLIYSNTDWINCILPSVSTNGSSQYIRYCNINGYQNYEGNINEDPLFVDPVNGNFHLQVSSPCINAGNPDTQYNDFDGTRNDMGAYGGPGGNW